MAVSTSSTVSVKQRKAIFPEQLRTVIIEKVRLCYKGDTPSVRKLLKKVEPRDIFEIPHHDTFFKILMACYPSIDASAPTKIESRAHEAILKIPFQCTGSYEQFESYQLQIFQAVAKIGIVSAEELYKRLNEKFSKALIRDLNRKITHVPNPLRLHDHLIDALDSKRPKTFQQWLKVVREKYFQLCANSSSGIAF